MRLLDTVAVLLVLLLHAGCINNPVEKQGWNLFNYFNNHLLIAVTLRMVAQAHA